MKKIFIPLYQAMPFDYRDLLAETLGQRVAKNPRYSLRAFAQDLGVSPSRLSELINKKVGTGLKLGSKIAEALGLSPQERELFLLSVEALHARRPQAKETARTQLERRLKKSKGEISLARFEPLAHWYFFAILELLDSDLSVFSHHELAAHLALPLPLIERAMEILEREGMIRPQAPYFVCNRKRSQTPEDIPSDTIKRFHEEVLQLAGQALWQQPPPQREFSTLIFALDPKALATAKDIIRRCVDELTQLSQQSKPKTAIYLFSEQLFRLNKESL